jgi:glycosyltransferase involved in cell wall biosynthesis
MWSEGTSLSAIEAMWHGGAVVATNVGGLGNIILDGDNGLLTDVDGAAFTAALRRLVEDADLRRRLGARAYDTARCCFSLDLWERRVWDVLAPIVEP